MKKLIPLMLISEIALSDCIVDIVPRGGERKTYAVPDNDTAILNNEDVYCSMGVPRKDGKWTSRALVCLYKGSENSVLTNILYMPGYTKRPVLNLITKNTHTIVSVSKCE